MQKSEEVIQVEGEKKCLFVSVFKDWCRKRQRVGVHAVLYIYAFTNSLNACSTASSVTLTSSSVCSVVTNQASYLDGARLIP